MTRSASRGISSKLRDHAAPRAGRRARDAARRPTCRGRAGARNSSTSALLLLAHLDVALGDQRPRRVPASCAGTSSSRDYDARASPSPPRHGRRGRARSVPQRRRPGPGPAPEVAQPVAHRLGGDRLGRARGLQRVVRRARGARRASRSACSPSRARRRRDGARRGSRRARSPSKKTSVACVAMAAGDDDARAGRARGAPARAPRRVRVLVGAGEHARLGEVRRHDRGARQHRSRSAARGVVVQQPARPTRRPSPGRSRSASRGRARRAPARPPRSSRPCRASRS